MPTRRVTKPAPRAPNICDKAHPWGAMSTTTGEMRMMTTPVPYKIPLLCSLSRVENFRTSSGSSMRAGLNPLTRNAQRVQARRSAFAQAIIGGRKGGDGRVGLDCEYAEYEDQFTDSSGPETGKLPVSWTCYWIARWYPLRAGMSGSAIPALGRSRPVTPRYDPARVLKLGA